MIYIYIYNIIYELTVYIGFFSFRHGKTSFSFKHHLWDDPHWPSRECSPWSELKGCPSATFAPTPSVRPGTPGGFGADWSRK